MDVQTIKSMKGKEKISVITCYDYSFASAIKDFVDIILVGDSLGNVVLGYKRTKHVTMEDMIRHLQAVRRGAPRSLIVCDLPFGKYENEKDAIRNAKKLINAGADAVKPEGRPEIVKSLVLEGIHVMGHVGLLPQTAVKFGKIGKNSEETTYNMEQAKKIANAGAFSIVLELITDANIKIPTIGIGAGRYCDGQVLVLYDLLGLYPDFEPKFVRKYMNLKQDVSKAVMQYSKDVKNKKFP